MLTAALLDPTCYRPPDHVVRGIEFLCRKGENHQRDWRLRHAEKIWVPEPNS
jgi:hypothetical protein